MGKAKSTLYVFLALIGGYLATRFAVSVFFESAAAAITSDREQEASVEEGAQPAPAANAASAAAAPAATSAPQQPAVADNWRVGSSSNSSGWSADASWTQPAPAAAPAAAPAPTPPSEPEASNTSRNAGP